MHPSKRPFDLPQNSALGVYLQASKADIKERSRVLLQVGLQATERHSGSRPAMNVGIVLDLRGSVSAGAQQIYRSIVTAFEKAKDLGDRFSLTVAGVPGGTIVLPNDFKHGPITVSLDDIFAKGGKDENLASGSSQSLFDALRQATKVVKENDSPDTTLGSSVVVLVTSSGIERHESAALVDFAQQNAIAGIPLSVIGVGDKFDSLELDNLVLAGQGNKRVVLSPTESQELVQKELTATSKVVARAVRLNILLSPGVKLVDVLGSSRLDSQQVVRVKDAEKSIDNRISRNLGIEADRGEDDAGIQIIIPTFYSNDSHVILLDVVAPGPGPIATVTARFKDLVFLRNGVSKTSLELDSFSKKETPLVKDVIKNRLAMELVDVLNTASKELREHNWNEAIKVLEDHKSLLQDVVENELGFARDEDILNDISIISECISVLRNNLLGSNRHNGEAKLSYLADAFEYVAFRKILPAPNALR